MGVRLTDIAARAGVSAATVSRVLNGRTTVSEPVRAAVLAALDDLGYERPPRRGRRSAGLVGLLVPELDNPVFPHMAQVIETALARAGYTSVLCTQTPGGVQEDEYVDMLLERGASGAVFVSGHHADTTTDHRRYAEMQRRGLHLVLVNGFRDGLEAPFVSCDDAAGVHQAVEHLVGLGHTRIGLATGQPRYVPVARKVAGFHEAVRRHLGVTADVDDLVQTTVFRVEGGQRAAAALLDRGATAVVCGSDPMALGAIREVRRRGMRVPHDVSVVGSDDSPLTEFTDPPLTTVRQPVAEMGAAVARILLDEMAGTPAPRAEYVFRPQLVVRGSTARAVHAHHAVPIERPSPA
ncbi:LacI family DNA-binding transcriptional regulator [Angustibacter speluncae]